ncbi:GntR family transcriptional regulator [Aquibacillus rhizosphaerae]|uniref:GntR family transcriptional regulator n=1 Tax=Aquibacillus rhizosphaerae TaxID=3051431 RepID=A0ABT7L5G6_9BACI|nr:GntR family transcriptional regulator [Aquibacillus sp. LR5S19]MDL4841096.1 GntR family transcriptional regulator [Aquibacillus sp. LR5S19]
MNILLSTTSKEPLFQQIKEQIKQQIYTGELTEGEALPSMRVLAKQLKVSVITSKRAYEDLEKEGFLVSSVGKGTFVAGQQPHFLREWQVRELENDFEQLIADAKRLGLTKRDLLERLEIFFEGDES